MRTERRKLYVPGASREGKPPPCHPPPPTRLDDRTTHAHRSLEDQTPPGPDTTRRGGPGPRRRHSLQPRLLDDQFDLQALDRPAPVPDANAQADGTCKTHRPRGRTRGAGARSPIAASKVNVNQAGHIGLGVGQQPVRPPTSQSPRLPKRTTLTGSPATLTPNAEFGCFPRSVSGESARI